MYSKQHRSYKNPSNSSDTPAPNRFAPRRFVVQPKTEEVEPVQEQTLDAQAKAERLKQVGTSFIDGAIFAHRPTPPKPPRIQMKLTLGQPRDMYQQEADKSRPDLYPAQKSLQNSISDVQLEQSSDVVQGKCSKCETDKSTGMSKSNPAADLLAMNRNGRCIKPEEVNQWIIEGNLAAAKGGEALLEFCQKLGQLLEDCHGELEKRYSEMLNDRRTGQNLYENNPTGKNSWQGHKKYYDNIRRESMPDLFKFFDKHCGNMEELADVVAVLENARDAMARPAPKEPLPKESNSFMDKVIKAMEGLGIGLSLLWEILKILNPFNPFNGAQRYASGGQDTKQITASLAALGLNQRQIEGLLKLITP